jgi:hypothetical protein
MDMDIKMIESRFNRQQEIQQRRINIKNDYESQVQNIIRVVNVRTNLETRGKAACRDDRLFSRILLDVS